MGFFCMFKIFLSCFLVFSWNAHGHNPAALENDMETISYLRELPDVYAFPGAVEMLDLAEAYVQPGEFHERGGEVTVGGKMISVPGQRELVEKIDLLGESMGSLKVTNEQILALQNFLEDRLAPHAMVGQATDWAYRFKTQIDFLDGLWQTTIADFREFRNDFPDLVLPKKYTETLRETLEWTQDPVGSVGVLWKDLKIQSAQDSWKDRQNAAQRAERQNPFKDLFGEHTRGDKEVYIQWKRQWDARQARNNEGQGHGQKFRTHLELRGKLLDAFVQYNTIFADFTESVGTQFACLKGLIARDEVVLPQTMGTALNMLSDFRVTQKLFDWCTSYYQILKALVIIQGHLLPQYDPEVPENVKVTHREHAVEMMYRMAQ